jgi:hypothetical protein
MVLESGCNFQCRSCPYTPARIPLSTTLNEQVDIMMKVFLHVVKHEAAVCPSPRFQPLGKVMMSGRRAGQSRQEPWFDMDGLNTLLLSATLTKLPGHTDASYEHCNLFGPEDLPALTAILS